MNKLLKSMIIGMLLIIAMPIAKLSAQVSTWDGTWEPWTHGTGTEADPFLIENARQLAYLAYRVNDGLDAGGGHVSNHNYHYKMMVDVDLNGSEDFQWTPIGYWNSNSDYHCFGGHFDGNGHSIDDLNINSTDYWTGFFGLTDGATIANLSIDGAITFSSSGNRIAGGFVGHAIGTIIRNCVNKGNVSGTCCGGLVGTFDGEGINMIINCYNTGTVGGSDVSGGIVGGDYQASSAYSAYIEIMNCYNIGEICGDPSHKGGIIGGRWESTCFVKNCYYLNTCGGNSQYGGEPETEFYMKSSEFVDLLNDGSCSWDYDQGNINSGYPVLTRIVASTSTLEPTNITQTHATLRGTINTENSVVLSQGFEYKRYFSSYNYQTVNVSGNGNISTTISGLEPNTQYKYRTFCTVENCGTFYGEEKTFTTLPIRVTPCDATNVTTSSAILHGSIDVGDATLIHKGFRYGPMEEPDIEVYCDGDDNDFELQINGLQINTTYCYFTIAEIENSEYGSLVYSSEYGYCFDISWLNSDTIYIYDADMLQWVSEKCSRGVTFQDKYIKLMNDITLPPNIPNNMTPIGEYPYRPFKGTFDGNGKHIYNLYIDQPNTPYQGFFGYTLNANLYNIGLVNITASGRNYTGGMVAYAENTHLRDCYVNGGTLFALSYCGGLIGYQEQGTNSIVSGCYNTCSVNGNHYVGGLIGFSNYSTVRNSYVAGPVSGQGNGIGAIIGGANEVLMYYCYFSTEMTGQTNAIGENNIGGGKDGGEGLTNAQMRDPQFVATLNQGLMTPVWMADYATPINNGFPIIKWQRPGTGVEENNIVKDYVSLYPNPANGFVTIQSDEPSVSLQFMEVYDATGRKVMSEILDGQSQQLSLDKLLSGVYHVRIQTDNGCYTHLKLVVQ